MFTRDLSLFWHGTQLLSNAVQKVKSIILEIFEMLGRRPEWRVTIAFPDRLLDQERAGLRAVGEAPHGFS